MAVLATGLYVGNFGELLERLTRAGLICNVSLRRFPSFPLGLAALLLELLQPPCSHEGEFHS